jgi:fumarate reductase flavoprotein subunit
MSSYGMAELQYMAQPGGVGYAIFDDQTKRKIATYDDVVRHVKVVLPETEVVQRGFMSGAVDDHVKEGRVVRADSLEVLAQLLGLPLPNLQGTLERYNGHVSRGHDDDYLKSSSSLMPVATPPFYAFPVRLQMYGLTGVGIRIDHDACVMHRSGRAVPGLFAAGECAGGVLGSVYVGSGNSLGNCTTYGRIAGRNAAAFALQGRIPPMDWKAIGVEE